LKRGGKEKKSLSGLHLFGGNPGSRGEGKKKGKKRGESDCRRSATYRYEEGRKLE